MHSYMQVYFHTWLQRNIIIVNSKNLQKIYKEI